MDANKNNLSREELIEKEKAVVDRICHDDKYAYYFFHEKCRPLFSKILWTIFGNNTSYANGRAKIDISLYLEAMPNERYRHVIHSLFIKDMEPEELAVEMDIRVTNIYNIKKRALDQLRDLAIYYNEIKSLEKHINLISDDIKREVLTSLFIERASYDVVCSKMNISETELKKLKKDAMKELRNIIFKTK